MTPGSEPSPIMRKPHFLRTPIEGVSPFDPAVRALLEVEAVVSRLGTGPQKGPGGIAPADPDLGDGRGGEEGRHEILRTVIGMEGRRAEFGFVLGVHDRLRPGRQIRESVPHWSPPLR